MVQRIELGGDFAEKKDDDEEAHLNLTLMHIEPAVEFFSRKIAENIESVERRDRDEIEDSKSYVYRGEVNKEKHNAKQGSYI